MAALSSGAMLSACGGDPAPAAQAAAADGPKDVELQVYENVFACAKATGKTTDECEEMRAEAQKIAAADAPRFEAKEDCEAVYGPGQCVQENSPAEEQTSGRRSHYSGFIVAWFSTKKDGRTGPLYKSTAGGYQTANGSRLGYGGQPGKYMASGRAMERAKSVPKVKPASQMARAAGFGKPGYGKKDANFGRNKASGGGIFGGSSSRSKGG
ncbi:DUF1190 domain-containing protein [uncultured Erythrobacter sp.]|uniref:DUF1190 domain-containing protein n=1 Tax=uncultured Erythrobacter sp. TaxID=263913 RepID=UPI00260874AD|nr:DUF1190 domain-containing protein [uncultured Erythrobacter sp.]